MRAGAIRIGLLLLALAPFAARAQPAAPQAPVAPERLIEPTLAADAEFARNIALIRADLLIADALVKERDWVDAHAHVSLPREEIYSVIRDELRSYKTPQFDGALRELSHAVAARSIKGYGRALKKVQAALVDAEFALRARQKDWPRFTLTVAIATLREAADEYDDAVSNGRVVRAVGYRSARGIVFETDRMLDVVDGALIARDPQAVKNLRGIVIHLKDAFAPLSPPKEPRTDVETVRRLIAQADALARAIK